jgi:hypothetical protein
MVDGKHLLCLSLAIPQATPILNTASTQRDGCGIFCSAADACGELTKEDSAGQAIRGKRNGWVGRFEHERRIEVIFNRGGSPAEAGN